MDDIYARAKHIRLAIFDLDGILTDGGLYFCDSGEETKAFNSIDGQGMNLLRESGVELAIITGRKSRLAEHRAKNLGIELLFQNVADKAATYEQLLSTRALSADATAYMGDDIVDLPILRRCGFAATVPSAPLAVKLHAHHVTRAHAGHGAAREVCELIMHAQGTLKSRIISYLK